MKIIYRDKLEERRIVVQMQLTMLLNEQIWSAINDQDFSKAAQYYLLAQHVHTGNWKVKFISYLYENHIFVKKV